MDLSSPWLWIPVFVTGVGLAIGTRIYSTRRRKRLLLEYASRIGLHPHKGKPFSKAERKSLPLLRRGTGGKITNLFSDGTNYLFDYTYKFGMPGVASVVYAQTVAAFRVNAGQLTDFQLAPKEFLDKVGTKLGLEEVKLDSIPEFTNRRWLRGKDRFAVEHAFVKAAPTLEKLDPTAKWSFEKSGDWLLLFRNGVLWNPIDVPELWKFGLSTREVMLQGLSHDTIARTIVRG